MVPRILQTVFDAVDARAEAEFLRQLLGLRYRDGDEPPASGPDEADWLVLLAPGGGRSLAVQRVDELAATTWPSARTPMQLHVDCTVTDRDELEAAREQALELGGRLVLDRSDDGDEPLYVVATPAGHPLCLFVA